MMNLTEAYKQEEMIDIKITKGCSSSWQVEIDPVRIELPMIQDSREAMLTAIEHYEHNLDETKQRIKDEMFNIDKASNILGAMKGVINIAKDTGYKEDFVKEDLVTGLEMLTKEINKL